MDFNILLRLLCVHFVFDFILQPSSLVKKKVHGTTAERAKFNLLHSLLQAVAAYIVVGQWEYWYIPVVIFTSHFAIDFWYKGNKKGLQPFIIDQLLHITVIILLWLYCTNGFSTIGYPLSELLSYNKIWIILIAYILVLKPTSVVISMFIERWSKQLKTGDINMQEKGLKDAGLWIGYIERFLIVTFIFTENFEAIGFLLAAKSIFRYGDLKDLKDIKMTEYVLIGTLASFSIAVFIGVVFKFCLF